MAPIYLKRLTALQSTEIRRMHTRFGDIALENLTRNIVETRLASIEKIWEEIRATHAEIIVKDTSATDPYVIDNVFAQIEDAYESAQNEMLRALNQFDASSKNTPSLASRSADDDGTDMNSRTAKLPKLDLPTFSGRYEDWEDFCDLFSSLVHNIPGLSNVTKLQYLKLFLTGSAADLVKDVATTNANYLSTWQALKVRFSNPRLTVNNHLTALMNLPHLNKKSAEELQAFSDEAQRIVRALTSLGMPVEHWAVWLVYILASRLNPESRKLWEANLSVKDRQAVARAATSSTELSRLERFPSFRDFAEFLDQRSHALGMVAAETKTNRKFISAQFKPGINYRRALHLRTGSNTQTGKSASNKCPLCKGRHYLGTCPNNIAKPLYDRRCTVRRLRLCFNCLGPHKFQNCESKGRCTICKEKHHSSIHSVRSKQEEPTANNAGNPDFVQVDRSSVLPTSVSTNTASLSSSRHSVLLATAQVILRGPRGTLVRVRAMLDQGSEVSFITESIVQLLKLPKRRAEISLTDIGASKAGTARATAQVSLQSLYDTSFNLETEVLILPRLTSQIPARKPIDLDLRQFSDISLADPHFLEPDSIDLILRADVYGRVLRLGLRRFPPSLLCAQDTALG